MVSKGKTWMLLLLISALLGNQALAGTSKADGSCMYAVAGKDATADGSVLMWYNNDWAINNDTYIDVVSPGTPQAPRYLRLFVTLNGKRVSEGGLNTNQLGALFGTATDIAAEVAEADPYCKKGIGWELWDRILETCSTSRCAMDVIEQVAGAQGFGAWSAGSMAFADPDEVWIVELLGCRHWVAARVPDDAYFVQPNMLRIRQVNLADRDNFRGSIDLEQFAISVGRYDPAQGPFDVAWAYADRTELTAYWNQNRLWRAVELLTPSLGFQPDAPYETHPVFLRPDYPLTKEDFMALARDHYEGTDFDQSQGYTLGSPHNVLTTRPICVSYTDYSGVWQLRDWLPDIVGGVLWLALAHPCSSAYVPFYAGVTSVPAPWRERSQLSAFNAFYDVTVSLDDKRPIDGDNRYHHYIPLVRGAFGALENDEFDAQSAVEAIAEHLWLLSPPDAEAYLTTTCDGRAAQAHAIALDLMGLMP